MEEIMGRMTERSERTRKLLILHVRKYPHLEIRDVLKFLHQSAFGCEHMVSSLENATEYIRREYESLSPNADGQIEPLDGAYSRVHLACLRDGVSAETLGRFFYASAKKELSGLDDLERKLAVARSLAREGAFPFSFLEFEEAIGKWRSDGYPAVRHSETFRANYRPAYRVIANEYLPLTGITVKEN